MTVTSEARPAVRYERGADGVVVLTLDDPQARVNTMNAAYVAAMGDAVARLEIERDSIVGVVVASAKPSFFAGGDLRGLVRAGPESAAEVFAEIELVKGQLRRLEQLGRPVVAAINGSALGGGLEIALACHRRIAVDDGHTEIGLPEVTLGLLPGGGGVARTVRMLGLQKALMEVLLTGKRMKPAQALEVGLVDELVDRQEDLLRAARNWVLRHGDDADAACQPWDRDGFRIPGGTPATPKLAAVLPAFPANLRKQLKGAPYPAPRELMAAAVEGAQVDFDTASRIESRYLTHLVTGQTSKNLIQALFFDLQKITSGKLRPVDVPPSEVAKVGVLGAGMMGAGIAYACARAGIDVVLKDVTQEAADRGRDHSAALLDKQVARGRVTGADKDAVLARITATDELTGLAGCDVVIEAVFEDAALKAAVFSEVQRVVGPETLLCSNTSTLPITSLAESVDRPQDFVGLHFFSPVDKMRLVEIIRGANTRPQTVARAYDLVQQIRKTPIVVNDSRGFYTSRVFGTLVSEGVALLAEGIDPATVERAATLAGFPAPPLAMLDEVSLTLTQHIRREAQATAAIEGRPPLDEAGAATIDRMVDEFGRPGRAAGAGFYDYPAGAPKVLWPGLRQHFTRDDVDLPLRDIQDRYLFVMALETVRCMAEGVLESAAAANIGSIFGIGFPPLFGGTVQFLNGYPGGLAAAVTRAEELATRFGPRFDPPDLLRSTAAAGGRL